MLFSVISLSSIGAVGITNSYNYSLSGQVMSMMWGILLMQLFFYTLGILFAGIFRNPKLSTTCVTTVIVVSYFVSVFADLNTNLEWLRYFTPFQWFSAPSIINSGHIGYGYVVVTIIASIVFSALAYTALNRRDITVA